MKGLESGVSHALNHYHDYYKNFEHPMVKDTAAKTTNKELGIKCGLGNTIDEHVKNNFSLFIQRRPEQDKTTTKAITMK